MFRMELPEPLLDGRAFERMHERAVKDSLREQMEIWQKKVLPDHFKATARLKYQHQERRPSWKAKKFNIWGSRTDLVASGKTKRFMTSTYRITVTGSAYGGGVVVTLRMRFPFPASFENSTNRVSLEQMAKEIGIITRDEADAFASAFRDGYVKRINEGLARSPRLSKWVGAVA